jgi:hypothetical protein
MTDDNGERPAFPRLEWIAELVGDRTYYAEGIRWRVFLDMDNAEDGKQVLVTLGSGWTILSGQDFLKLAQRIVPQLMD